ncbi:MAG: lipid A biosynthesis lauroyl acyltransferase [Rickettsiales bacterium]|jgi:KDO2-lipid IV(A) lauroyltransferase|nr:lipid A biosynthesis lauroyl acyltransferase [Rickettsiales bacterium]
MNAKHFIEALLLKCVFSAFRTMSLDLASFTGGTIARSIGPFLSAHQTAKKNLRLAYPKLSRDEEFKLLSAMWDNLGRTAAELAHLPGGLFSRVEMSGLEHIPKDGKPALFFSAHLANWELNAPMAFRHGVNLAVIYRHANNPYVDEMIRSLRSSQCNDQFAKGPKGGAGLMRALRAKQSIAMLIDQKMNDGIALPFFGHNAMTATAIAELALRFDLPIIPAHVVRTKGAHFKGIVSAPLNFEKTGDKEKDVRTIMLAINRMVEGWIREHPEQWFWVHKRWPKEAWGLR